MSSWRETFFGSPKSESNMRKVPSLDDFSMGVSKEVEELDKDTFGNGVESRRESMDSQRSAGSLPAASPRTNVWQSVFNPGKNFNMSGRDYFDYVDERPNAPKPATTWEYIAKAEQLKRLSFVSLDKNGDGYIDASELSAALGPQASVGELIKAADKNGDGKISYAEFVDLLKHS